MARLSEWMKNSSVWASQKHKSYFLKISSPKVSRTTPQIQACMFARHPPTTLSLLDQVPLIITELWFHSTGPFGPSENAYYFMIRIPCKLLSFTTGLPIYS